MVLLLLLRKTKDIASKAVSIETKSVWISVKWRPTVS